MKATGYISITDKIIFDEVGDKLPNLTIEKTQILIERLKPYLEKLRHTAHTEDFTEEQEIYFFKEIKPNIWAKILFFSRVYDIEINKNYVDSLADYYKDALYEIQEYFRDNLAIYQYCRSGANHSDKYYFTRACQNHIHSAELKHSDRDPKFYTNGDACFASIKANDMLYVYLTDKISSITNEKETPSTLTTHKLKWTDSKIAAVELGYALYSKGVLNNGEADIKDIMHFIESVFDIDLGDYYRSYLSIRERKKDKTVFLNGLIDGLSKKMTEDDLRQ